MPIAVDGRQFIHAPELGCVSEERHSSRCWSSRGLKVADRKDDLMSSHKLWRFWFSGTDGLVDDHTSRHESRACGMLSGSVMSDINDWLSEMEAKYAGISKSVARRKPMPPCCTPESDQFKFSLAKRGVCEPYANDASLKISGQFIMHLRRRTSRRMVLKAFFMSSLAGM